MEAPVLFLMKKGEVEAMNMRCRSLQAVRDTPILVVSLYFRQLPVTKPTHEDDLNPCKPGFHLYVDFANGAVADTRMPVLVRVKEQRVQALCLRQSHSCESSRILRAIPHESGPIWDINGQDPDVQAGVRNFDFKNWK